MKLSHGLLLCAALLGAGAARADFKPEGITAGEIALLPPYCIDTESMSDNDPRYSPRAKQWKLQMGETFMAMHHYCWGLIYMSRARQPKVAVSERKWHYDRAINDYEYVLQFAKSDFVLLPEIYLRMGETYIELKDYARAVESFGKALDAKRDYWPAYVRWSSVLSKLNKKRDAMSKLEEGLRIMPNEPGLIAPYEALGGNHKAFVKGLPPVTVARSGPDQLVPPPPAAAAPSQAPTPAPAQAPVPATATATATAASAAPAPAAPASAPK
jgi:tetratricopeptide (TPR) repeat protein